MRIVSQDQASLVAQDKATGGLVAGMFVFVIGLIVGAGSLGTHTLAPLGIGAVVSLVGAVVVIAHKERTLSIDKTAGQLTVRVKSVLKNDTQAHSIANVAKLQLVSSYQTTNTSQPGSGTGTGTSGSTQTTQRTRLLLVMRDGTTINLADAQRSMGTMGLFGAAPNQKVGQEVAGFLGVPFEVLGPQSVGQVVGAVRDMIMGRQAGAPSMAHTEMPPSDHER